MPYRADSLSRVLHQSVAADPWTVPLPAGSAAGDVVLFYVTLPAGAAADIDSYPAGVHPAKGLIQYVDATGDGGVNAGTVAYEADGDPRGFVFCYTVPTTPPSDISLGFTAAATGDVFAAAFTSRDTTDALSALSHRNHGSGAGATTICPSVTTPAANQDIVRGALHQSSVVMTPPPGGLATATQASGDSPSALMVVMGNQTSPGATGTADVTGVSGFGSGWTLALKAASVAPATGGYQLGAISY